MKKKVQKLVREKRLQDDLNVLKVLQIRFPRALACLKILPSGRRKCLICKEVEPWKKTKKFHECPNENCHFVYCHECWLDLGERCIACATADEETSSGLDSSSGDDD